MKKYLYSALALPLLFACSSEDLSEQAVVSNDQFAGIEKVDAVFLMDENVTRFGNPGDDTNGSWSAEEGDLWGFAWLGGNPGANALAINGNAYQNHNLIQKSSYFEPQTSIYLGKYYIYRPYDKTVVNIDKINFKSLENQPLTNGMTGQPWLALGKTAINIGDKWTDVVEGGRTYGTATVYDKPGIKQVYKLFAAVFSNQTGLDLTYVKNNPTFGAATAISGATDINYTYAAGTPVGAADIYEVTVDLKDGGDNSIAAKSFTYAPTAEPNDGVYPQVKNGKTVYHDGEFWADKSDLTDAGYTGFNFTDGAITLTPADAVNGVSTGADGSKGWFWFNSLPVTQGDGNLATNVQTKLTTSYGVVTVNKTIEQCAYEYAKYDGTGSNEWIKLVATADKATSDPKEWNFAGHNTFVNQYGNHHGKYAFDVDFSAGVMNGMHIKSDTHLQKLLKYYLASGKGEAVTLNLDGASASDKTFKISKISIALLQATGGKVKVKGCGEHNNPVKIIVTQDGQADLGLAAATEVPELNNVFAAPTDVYLAAKNTDGTDITWTWKQRTGTNQLTVDGNVSSLTNEGNLTVNASNIQLTNAAPITNAKDATMTLTQVTTVKNDLTNKGTINVGSESNTAAELRAYNATVTNEATALETFGTINNFGVVGKSAGTTGVVNNYGYIKMMNDDAITLLGSNQDGGNFGSAWADDNKMGTVELPEGNATALVSVSNATNQGFIKFKWTAATYATPVGNVKYNTIIVSNDITFTAEEEEIQYIEFKGNRTQVINPCEMPGYVGNKLTKLKGIVVHPDCSIIIEKNNGLKCLSGAYLAPANGGKKAATVYLGGAFDYINTTNYFGTWSLDQIVEW